MVSAVAGDFALGLLACHLHERYDGKWLENGDLVPWLIYGTIIGGIAIPIATQSIYDYPGHGSSGPHRIPFSSLS